MLGWVALAALNCAIIPYIGRGWLPPHDFGVFYSAAHVYLHDGPDRLYDLDVQAQTEKQLFDIPDDQLAKRFLPYNHLPYEVVVWLPLTSLGADRAFLIWRLESLALLVFSLWLFLRTIPIERDIGEVLAIALALFPVPFAFLAGQDTFITLGLFAVSLWLLKQQRNILAGAVLGLCLFKPQLVLPIVGIFFLRRSWKVIVGFASSGAAVLGGSTLMVGYRGMASLLRLWIVGESGGVACINPVTMPNVRGLLACLPGLTPHAVSITAVILSALLLFLAAHQVKIASTPAHLFAVAVCFVVLVSFHTNLYDLAILILPALVLLEADWKRSQWPARAALIVLFCPLSYLIALAAFRVAWLGLAVAGLWYALIITMRQREAVSVPVVSNRPELATVASWAGASRP